ncbi:MAG: ArdC family protein [Candidatus Humimicrobiaceae bacterium]
MENDKTKKIINLAVESLFEEIKIGKSQRLLDYLEFCSKFYSYSFSNTLLIWSQLSKAKRVAGFKKWSELGYKIKKGSKAISILAPGTSKYIIEDNKKITFRNMTTEQKSRKEEHQEEIYFMPVSVFDVSQTEKTVKAKVLADNYFWNIGNDFKAQYLMIKGIILNTGINVFESDTGNAEGISKGGEINIKKKNDYNNKLLTLIHEWAHEILHQNKKIFEERGVKEIQAEGVSYIVSRYIGLKNPFTSDYIQNWAKDKEQLKDNLTLIIKTSKKIIDIINKQNSGEIIY